MIKLMKFWMMKITINDKEYEVTVVETDEDKAQGLQEVEEMDDNEGMLFVYDSPQTLEFWMKDTDIPLDIIFIDSEWIIKSVQQGIPNTEDILSADDVQYVLELNQNSGVTEGMEVEIEDPDEWYEDLSINSMYIIGEDGKPQMELEGEERIFSRPNTKTLAKMAKRAYVSQKDSDYKRLGKKVFEYLKIQDGNPAQYVES